MDSFTIMSVTEITRNYDKFEIKDEGLEGFIIEYIRLEYYNDLIGYPYVRFRCFDDYSKFFDIDCWLHFLYSEKCDSRSSLIREDEVCFIIISRKYKRLLIIVKKNRNRLSR